MAPPTRGGFGADRSFAAVVRPWLRGATGRGVSWPRDASFEIAVLKQFGRGVVLWKRRRNDPRTADARMLHREAAVRVTGYENNPVDRPRGREVRDIEPDAYIDALLFKVGLEVGIRKWCAGYWYPLWLEAAEFGNYAPNGEEVLLSDAPEEAARPLECMLFALNGPVHPSRKRRAIIVEYP